MTPLARAARNVLFKALPSPFERLSRFVFVLVAAPVLGSERFGAYQFAATAGALLVSVTEFGVGTWTTRALARDVTDSARVVATGVRLRLVSALVYALALGTLCLFEANGDARVAFVLIGLAALGGSIVDYVGAVLRGYEEFEREAWIGVARAALTTAGALAALALTGSLMGLGVGLLVGTGATVALAGWGVKPRLLATGAWSPGVATIPWSDAGLVPLWLAGLFSVLYFRCDVVLLHSLTNDTEVGRYGAAYRVFEATTLAPAAIVGVAFPRLAQLRTLGGAGTALEYQLGALLGALGLGTAAVVHASSDWIVRLVFGPDFRAAAESLRILAFATPFLFLNFGLSAFLFARMLERRYVVLAGGLVVLNVLANLIAIPRWGAQGAAGVTVLSEVALVVGSLVALRRGNRPAGGLSLIATRSARQ